jgi:rRNA maturation RNase YbeY
LDQKIQFFSENITFRLPNKARIRSWLLSVIQSEKKKAWYINYIFCDDLYILELNKTYLDRDYFTDVISFSYSEEPGTVSGDIFISIDRVRENADKFGQSFDSEIRRIMVHGLLHLTGYRDRLKNEKKRITKKEDHYLSLFE